MTYGGPGHGQQGWPGGPPPPRAWPGQPGPGGRPLTLPGWGAVPAVLGAVLGLVGLFALDWATSVTFIDIRWAYLQAAGSDPTGPGGWLVIAGAALSVLGAAIGPRITR